MPKVGYMDIQLFGDSAGQDPSGNVFSADYVQALRAENASWRTKLRETETELDKIKKALNETETELDKIKKALNETETKQKDSVSQFQSFLSAVKKTLKITDDKEVATETLLNTLNETASKSTVSVEKVQEALRKAAFMSAAISNGIAQNALEDAYKLADFSSVKVDLESTSVFPVDKDGKQIESEGKPVVGLDGLVKEMVKAKPFLVGNNVRTGIGSPSNPLLNVSSNSDSENLGEVLGKKQVEMNTRYKQAQDYYFPK